MPFMKTFLLLLLTFFTISPTVFAQLSGTLSGKVTDKATNEPVIGAVVFITGSTKGSLTDENGNYSLKLEAGIYKIAVTYVSYKQITYDNIKIESGKTTTLNIGIEEDTKHLNAVTIVGTRQTNTNMALITELKKSEIVANGVSGEQIAKSLDRDAAETVKRIPGVTVMNNRYIYIRGLSERYNTVLMNDALTPSTEVDVKAFSFDILPTSVIDRIMIYKGGSPELPGEFGGGVIKVYTKNFADANETSLSVSTAYRGGTTFNDFSSYKGSKTDFLGFDNGYRALPNSFPASLTKVSAENLQTLGRQLPNSWGANIGTAAPDLRLSLGLNRRMNIGNVKISNITALTYSNTRQFTTFERNRYQENPNPEQQQSEKEFTFIDQQSNQNARLGLIHNWAVRLNDNNKIEFRNLFNQLGSSEVVNRSGNLESERVDIQSISQRYESRGIYSGQLQGTHNYNEENTEFTWTTGYSRTNRNEPDFRRARYQRNTGTNDPFLLFVPFGADPQQAGRFYSELKENIYMAGSQIEQTFGAKDSSGTDVNQVKVRAGFYTEHKTRDFNARWMSYAKGNAVTFDESLRALSLNQVFAPENINNITGFKLAEGTNPSDQYQASNDLLAGYVGGYVPVSGNFNAAGGVRIEHNRQQLTSAEFGGKEIKVDNPVTYVLPSLNLTYNLSQKSMLRFGSSVSVNRPEFREIAPFSYFDFQLNSEIKGNPNLKSATIYNTDLRYEFYPNPTETVSFGAFYKYFKNPIESTILGSSGNPIFFFTNADFSTSYGLETEVRKSFLDLSTNRIIQNTSLVLNASLIKSQIDLGDQAEGQEQKRAMMGQSPYIVNAGLYYQEEESGLQVSMLYNVIGKRIFLVGNYRNPTVYEMPRNVIDLTITKSIGNRLEIKGGIQDILNQKSRLVQDTNLDGKITSVDENIANNRRGSYSSVGMSYKF
jgi:TonB-dependent receptor